MSNILDRAIAMEENGRGDLTRKQLAEIFGVTPQTISNWLKAGKIPKPNPFNGVLSWSKDEIVKFIKERESSDS